jgi:hypothetical protein
MPGLARVIGRYSNDPRGFTAPDLIINGLIAELPESGRSRAHDLFFDRK